MSFLSRNIKPRIQEALMDTPVVLLNGPRQAGKTTLVKQWLAEEWTYLTLDDASTLLSAQQDPVGFIRRLDRAIIDEVQRAPDVLLAIKKSVDEDRRPGRFLLTGSANVMAMPALADSLAGRMETLNLLPLAGCEIQGGLGNWLDTVFSGGVSKANPNLKNVKTGNALLQTVLQGGYPEAVSRSKDRRRNAWARNYVEALISRDVRDIASVEKLDHLPRLLKALAQMSGQLCNFTQLAGQVGLDNKTASKYLAVFEHMFLMRRLQPWSANRLSRILKTPKIHFLDSGLLCSQIGLNEVSMTKERARFGHALESYVYAELLKQASWANSQYTLYSYRDKDQVEVDFVIEDDAGLVIAVEVKASATVQQQDFTGIKKLAALAGATFVLGIVLYDGDAILPMGDGLWAIPLSTLWQW